jgi:serine phosphatase RsbU (regulator of sigma subunit)
MRESIKQVLVARELEMASEMQGMLLPTSLPNDKYMQVTALY